MSKLSHLWFSRPDKYGKINYKPRPILYTNWCVLLLSMENQTDSRCCWSIQMNTNEHLPSSAQLNVPLFLKEWCPGIFRGWNCNPLRLGRYHCAIPLGFQTDFICHWNYQAANAKCQTQRRLLRLENHFAYKVVVPLFQILIAIHPWSFNIQ